MRLSSSFLVRSDKGFLIAAMLVSFVSVLESVGASDRLEVIDEEQVVMENYRLAFSFGDFPALRKLTKAENAAMQEACGLVNHNKIPLKMANAPFAEMEEWPWLVSIALATSMNSDDQKVLSSCTGSIVSPWHVISASHCVDSFHNVSIVTDSLVRFVIKTGGICVGYVGSSKILGCRAINMTQTRSVRKVLFSSSIDFFFSFAQSEDISIYEVSEPFEFNELVRPLCVGRLFMKNLYNFIQVGYGRDINNKTGALNWMHVGKVELSTFSARFTGYSAYQNYPEPETNFGGIGTCSGDSGGPTLVRSVGSSRYFLMSDLTGGGLFFQDITPDCGVEGVRENQGPAIPLYAKWICKMIGLCREPMEVKSERRLNFLS